MHRRTSSRQSEGVMDTVLHWHRPISRGDLCPPEPEDFPSFIDYGTHMNMAIDLMELQTGDLILCTGRGVASKALQVGQGVLHGTMSAPYSHAAIVLAPGYLLEAVHDKGVWVNCLIAEDARFELHGAKVVLPIRPRQHGYTKFHVYRHTYFASIDNDGKRKFIDIAMEHYGEDYASKFHFLNLLHQKPQDILNVQGFLKTHSATQRDRLSIGESFCSELAARVYAAFGLFIPQAHMPSPVALGHEKWRFARVLDKEICETELLPVTETIESGIALQAALLYISTHSPLIRAHFQGTEIDRFSMHLIVSLQEQLLTNNFVDPVAFLKAGYKRRGKQIADHLAPFEDRMKILIAQLNLKKQHR